MLQPGARHPCARARGRSGSTDSPRPDSLAAGAFSAKLGVCAELLQGALGVSCLVCWLSLRFWGFPGLGGEGAFPAAVAEFGPGTRHSRRLSLCSVPLVL